LNEFPAAVFVDATISIAKMKNPFAWCKRSDYFSFLS